MKQAPSFTRKAAEAAADGTKEREKEVYTWPRDAASLGRLRRKEWRFGRRRS